MAFIGWSVVTWLYLRCVTHDPEIIARRQAPHVMQICYTVSVSGVDKNRELGTKIASATEGDHGLLVSTYTLHVLSHSFISPYTITT